MQAMLFMLSFFCYCNCYGYCNKVGRGLINNIVILSSCHLVIKKSFTSNYQSRTVVSAPRPPASSLQPPPPSKYRV